MKLLEEKLREAVKEFYTVEFEVGKLKEELALVTKQWKTHQARAERAEIGIKQLNDELDVARTQWKLHRGAAEKAEAEILVLKEKYEDGHQ